MRRRAPGQSAASPLRRWPGAVVVAAAVTAVVLAGGAAVALVDTVVAGPVNGGADPTAALDLAAGANPSTSTTSTEPDAEAAEAQPGTYGVRTFALTLTDDTRDRTLAVTVYAPDASGTFPLVVFVHGYAASAATYSHLEVELAEAGFVVAAPDFPLSSSAATSAPQRDIAAQATDVSFVIDTLLDPSTEPAVTAAINPSEIAVAGHSDGAVTAAAVGFNDTTRDPRVAAVVSYSGGAFGVPGAWFTEPDQPALLAVHGTADTVNPLASSNSLVADAGGAALLVPVAGGTHTSPFVDDGATVDAVAALTADFLHATLDASTAAARRLAADEAALEP